MLAILGLQLREQADAKDSIKRLLQCTQGRDNTVVLRDEYIDFTYYTLATLLRTLNNHSVNRNELGHASKNI